MCLLIGVQEQRVHFLHVLGFKSLKYRGHGTAFLCNTSKATHLRCLKLFSYEMKTKEAYKQFGLEILPCSESRASCLKS